MALNHHFSDLGQFSTGLMEGAAGGYECLDTTQALESCGGCASTGEGQDCTKIRGAQGYACEASVCRVCTLLQSSAVLSRIVLLTLCSFLSLLPSWMAPQPRRHSLPAYPQR